jgi:hypothetical protein
LDSGLKIEDIAIGKEYGYWVYLDTQNSFAVCDIVSGRVVKKGKKKIAILVKGWDKLKWKYPHELTACF